MLLVFWPLQIIKLYIFLKQIVLFFASANSSGKTSFWHWHFTDTKGWQFFCHSKRPTQITYLQRQETDSNTILLATARDTDALFNFFPPIWVCNCTVAKNVSCRCKNFATVKIPMQKVYATKHFYRPNCRRKSRRKKYLRLHITYLQRDSTDAKAQFSCSGSRR